MTPSLFVGLVSSLIIVALVLAQLVQQRHSEYRIIRLEREFYELRAQFTREPVQDRDFEVRLPLERGAKIDAIKCYRELHHVGLREAKQAVDGMTAI